MRRLIILLLATSLLTACSGVSIPWPARSTGASEDSSGVPGESPHSATPTAQAPASFVLVLDVSGSMAEADLIGGGDRMGAARDASKKFVEALPPGSRVALVTYGDQTPKEAPRETSCQDVSVKIPLSESRDGFAPALDALQPSGWTPIGEALETAAGLVPTGERTSVVLVSDGEDSCAPPDPCDVARELVAANLGLSISTIGVRSASAQLACIAERGRGIAVNADSATQLARRLPALSDPAAAADQLSTNGVQRVRPGSDYAAIREMHPDFPTLPAPVGEVIKVVWRNCEWLFDTQSVLRGIVLESGMTIDGIVVGDPIGALDVLGSPVFTQPTDGGGETLFYLADARLGLAWKVTVADGRVRTIILCTCLPVAPCPPDDDMVRQIQGDPTMQIKSSKCTADNTWAVIDASFESDLRSGFLVLKRTGVTWSKVARLTHGGGCFDIPADAPRAELDAAMGGWCAAIWTGEQMRNAQITTDGIGPMRLGMTGQELERLHLARRWSGTDCPRTWDPGDAVPENVFLEFRGDRLTGILVANPGLRTASGARIGDTPQRLEQIYSGKLESFSWIGEGGYAHSRAIVSGNRMVAFQTGYESTTYRRIERIFIQYREDSFVGGC